MVHTIMVLEACLLFGIVLLMSFVEITSTPFLFVFGVVMLLCLPLIRYVPMHAPPFVPTPRRIAAIMLELAAIRPGEKMVDLGCGDGRLVIAAAKLGADAVGYELSIPTWFLAKVRAWRTPHARIECRNFWAQSFVDTDVILCYLLPSAMERLEREIWPQLKPGCRLISHAFKLPTVLPREQKGGVYAYIKVGN